MLVLKEITPIIIVFCYIFSFYVIGPITSSMVIAVPIIVTIFMSKTQWAAFFEDLHCAYTTKIILFLCMLMGLGLLYSSIHLTFDLSYVKVLFGQLIQLVLGIFIVSYLRVRFHFDALKIEKTIIFAFLLQSIIQIVALAIPPFANAILYFSKAYELQEAYGGGVRGLALASGVGWSLALSYGLVYIIFIKRYLLQKIKLQHVALGMLLLMGTFFAGRTGFVGALLGILLFFFSNQKNCGLKLALVFKVLLCIILFCFAFYVLFPSITKHLINNVFPFVFEPFYKLYYNGEFSTGSTDRLGEMWATPISWQEILVGTGYFTDPYTGFYYNQTDVGILRNLFYWGFIGYGLMIIYQYVLIMPIRYFQGCSTSKWDMQAYKLLIMLYFVLLDFKAMTLGFNKMTFSIIFLLFYFYFADCRKLFVR